MEIIIEPVREKEVLLATSDGASAPDIVEGMLARGDGCVDHLCGC